MTFLLIMINILTLILAINNYLITTNNIEADLYNFIDDFSLEAELINKAKCVLLNEGDLDDLFLANGIAYVNKNNNDYYISYGDLNILLKVDDRIIIDYIIL